MKRNVEGTSIQQRFGFGTSHAEAALKAARAQLSQAGCLATNAGSRRILFKAGPSMLQLAQTDEQPVLEISEDSPLAQRLRKRHHLRTTLVSTTQDEQQGRTAVCQGAAPCCKQLSVKEERLSAVVRQRPRWRHDVLFVKRKLSMVLKYEPIIKKSRSRQRCKSEVRENRPVKQSPSWRRRSYWRLSRLYRSIAHLRACLLRSTL